MSRVRRRASNKNEYSGVSGSESEDSQKVRFRSKPFFDKKLDQEFYGEEYAEKRSGGGESAEEDAEQNNQSNSPSFGKILLNIFSFIIFLMFVGAVSFMTSFYLNKNLEKPQILVENITEVMNSLRKEIKNERTASFSKANNIEELLKSSFEKFTDTLQDRFVQKSLLQKIFKDFDESFRIVHNKVADNVEILNLKDGKKGEQIVKMNQLIEKLNDKINAMQKQLKGGKEIQKGLEEMKKIQKKIEGVMNSDKGKVYNNFVDKKYFDSEMSKLNEKMSFENFLKRAIQVRDGTKVDHASKLMGGTVITVQNRFAPVLGPANRFYSVVTPVRGPGDCLCLKPVIGYLVIGLREKVVPTGFSYESVRTQNVPFVGTRPREVRIWGISKARKKVDLNLNGKTFKLDGSSILQEFEFKDIGEEINEIRFDFVNNYGNDQMTCVYRLRVFGKKK